MEFHRTWTLYNSMKKQYPSQVFGTALEFYPELSLRVFEAATPVERLSKEHQAELYSFMTEYRWYTDRQPFYNVWPSVISMLVKMDLNHLTSAMVPAVMPALSVRLPVTGNTLRHGNVEIRSFLVGAFGGGASLADLPEDIDVVADLPLIPFAHNNAMRAESRGFYMIINPSTVGAEKLDKTVFIFFTLEKPEHTIGYALSQSCAIYANSDPEYSKLVPGELVEKCMRLYCTLCLLDQDSELLDRIVLAADRPKYESTHDEKYLKRAEKRGVLGWDIGKNVEVVPHVRRPHFAIRWTGEGGLIPKVRPIKGSLVHRNKLLEVPTGYEADMQPEPELSKSSQES